jgi:hypothetical protein
MELDSKNFTEKIYIDTNILLYSAFNHPGLGESCKNFLAHNSNEEIRNKKHYNI